MSARLVYKPKVWAYTKDVNGNLYDLTHFIVSGRVERLINQVSTAELTLRNPNKVFTNPKEGIAFHPMDPITIWLERSQGHPVQVFTGFLDDTPYYQLFPGTVKLKASCTLKRLLYVYWDPALPYTISFLKQFGWTSKGDGTVTSAFEVPYGLGVPYTGKNLVPFGANAKEEVAQKAGNDASIARLLWALLYYVAQIQDESIYIEAIPPEVGEIVARLFQNFNEAQKEANIEMEDFFQKIIGTASQGSGGASGEEGRGKATGPVIGLKKMTEVAVASSNKAGIPPELTLAVMHVETTFSNKDTPGNPHYGWFQMKEEEPYPGAGHVSQKEAHDLGIASSIFCKAAKKVLGENPGLRNNLLEWAEKVQGVTSSNNPYYVTDWATATKEAQDLIAKYGKGSAGEETGRQKSEKEEREKSSESQRGSTDESGKSGEEGWAEYVKPFKLAHNVVPSRTDEGVDYTCGVGDSIVAIGDGVITKVILGAVFGGGPIMTYQIHKGPLKGQFIYYSEGIVPTKKEGDPVKAGEVIATTNSQEHGLEFGYGKADGWPAALEAYKNVPDGTPMPEGHMFDRLMRKLGVPGSYNKSGNGPLFPGGNHEIIGEGAGESGGGEASATDPLIDAKAAAFTASISFPGVLETAEAEWLKGNKALMNDVSLMPFIQQVCQASMRSFMSLPNGDFFAFYPDYFGEMGHRKPYWLIKDIEILDGGINLSDKYLATHVFAVGDNSWPVSDQKLNQLNSAGTVNIFNAFEGGGFLDTSASEKKATSKTVHNKEGTAIKGISTVKVLEVEEAQDFLKRYGARPLVMDFPMVRSPLYEMLMSYQGFMLAWSRQFITPFKFTFMPELFPGGKVGFPEHGLQMYIESVVHSFNFEDGTGFTTDAKLSAPSVMEGENSVANPELPPHMVSALSEPIKGKTKASKETGQRTTLGKPNKSGQLHGG